MTTEQRLSEVELTVDAISILTNRVVDWTMETRRMTEETRRMTEKISEEVVELKAQGERDRIWMQEMIEGMNERIEEQRRYNLHLRPLWIHFGKHVGLPDGWIDEID